MTNVDYHYFNIFQFASYCN